MGNLKRIRALVIPLLIGIALVWVMVNALIQPPLPEFKAQGEPVELPASGHVPDVSLNQFEGMLINLEGKPVVVNIWASWCAPCRTEMPLLAKAAEQFDGDAVILGVAARDSPDAARSFLDELGITYPNVIDSTGDVANRLEVHNFPTTYVFSSDGDLLTTVAGGISEQRLAGLIEDALR